MTGIDWLTAQPIAHRGLHDKNRSCWENSPTAFRRAVERGFAIECDVQITRDDRVVVFHDYDLKRLTGGTGFVRGKTVSEMTRMAIGTTGEFVPTLTGLLDIVDGKVPLIIELKANPGQDDAMLEAVARDLEPYRGPVAVMSFGHHFVRQFGEMLPGIPTGLVAEGIRPRELEGHFSMLAHKLDFVSFNVDELPNPFIEIVRGKLGLPAITWTVRTPEQVSLTRAHADQMTFEGFDPANEAP